LREKKGYQKEEGRWLTELLGKERHEDDKEKGFYIIKGVVKERRVLFGVTIKRRELCCGGRPTGKSGA